MLLDVFEEDEESLTPCIWKPDKTRSCHETKSLERQLWCPLSGRNTPKEAGRYPCAGTLRHGSQKQSRKREKHAHLLIHLVCMWLFVVISLGFFKKQRMWEPPEFVTLQVVVKANIQVFDPHREANGVTTAFLKERGDTWAHRSALCASQDVNQRGQCNNNVGTTHISPGAKQRENAKAPAFLPTFSASHWETFTYSGEEVTTVPSHNHVCQVFAHKWNRSIPELGLPSTWHTRGINFLPLFLPLRVEISW